MSARDVSSSYSGVKSHPSRSTVGRQAALLSPQTCYARANSRRSCPLWGRGFPTQLSFWVGLLVESGSSWSISQLTIVTVLDWVLKAGGPPQKTCSCWLLLFISFFVIFLVWSSNMEDWLEWALKPAVPSLRAQESVQSCLPSWFHFSLPVSSSSSPSPSSSSSSSLSSSSSSSSSSPSSPLAWSEVT